MTEQLPLSFDRSQFRPDFAEWLLANGHIWSAFAARADAVWNRGRRHYSARTIIEVLRYESTIAEVGSEWKINNNYAPDLARLYRQTYPDRAALFELRLMPGSERAA